MMSVKYAVLFMLTRYEERRRGKLKIVGGFIQEMMKKVVSGSHSEFIQHTLINYVPTINFN